MKGKIIRQKNNLLIRYTEMYQFAVWTPDGICLEDRLTLKQAEEFCRENRDYCKRKVYVREVKNNGD